MGPPERPAARPTPILRPSGRPGTSGLPSATLPAGRPRRSGACSCRDGGWSRPTWFEEMKDVLTGRETAAQPREGWFDAARGEPRAASRAADARLMTQTSAPPPPQSAARLLGAAEAAKALGISPRWLRRHAARLPFTRRIGRAERDRSHQIDPMTQNGAQRRKRRVAAARREARPNAACAVHRRNPARAYKARKAISRQ
jgi:hypothetical protein